VHEQRKGHSVRLFNPVVAALSFLLGVPTLYSAAAYTITDLEILPGTASSAGYSINNHGDVVGDVTIARSIVNGTSVISYGFVYHNGVMTNLTDLNGPGSLASSINDSGQIAGNIYTGQRYSISTFPPQFLPVSDAAVFSQGVVHDIGASLGDEFNSASSINSAGDVVGGGATTSHTSISFLYTNGVTSVLTTNPPISSAIGINDAGQITGGMSVGQQTHAFLDTTGALLDLGTLGGNSFGNSVNNAGHVAGFSDTGAVDAQGQAIYHAFLYTAGPLLDLGTLGGNDSQAKHINSVGQIVGYSLIAGNTTAHAFLYKGGSMSDLNTLIDPLSGWQLVVAYGNNDLGQITGQGIINGQTHAFILTPTPEPSSFVLAAFGVASLAVWGWRRKR
jgi:probable HAF family extracellular repeat protein